MNFDKWRCHRRRGGAMDSRAGRGHKYRAFLPRRHVVYHDGT